MKLTESNVELVRRARRGDADAVAGLLARTVPLLTRWARGRLPRDLGDASDARMLVSNAIALALPGMPVCDSPGALQAFFRDAVAVEIARRGLGPETATAEVDRRC